MKIGNRKQMMSTGIGNEDYFEKILLNKNDAACTQNDG